MAKIALDILVALHAPLVVTRDLLEDGAADRVGERDTVARVPISAER
jgi:hypothetical protein